MTSASIFNGHNYAIAGIVGLAALNALVPYLGGTWLSAAQLILLVLAAVVHTNTVAQSQKPTV